MYPVRIRFPNVLSGKSNWLTIGYIPLVRPKHAVKTKEKARLCQGRDSLTQRCLAGMLDGLIEASKDGVAVNPQQHGPMMAFPRVVLYAADQPEEFHVLGLQGNRCGFPCSECSTTKNRPRARTAVAGCRDVLDILTLQL